MIKEELRLDSITGNYYSFKLCKEEEVSLGFDNAELIFKQCLIFKCGYPNDEIYFAYDYYTQGSMEKYCLYEVLESGWIKELCKMNSVHPRHTDDLFKNDRHFIILFEDEVFECIAKSYEVAK
jgi:hypothetical protein